MGMTSTNDPSKMGNPYDIHYVSGIIGAGAAIAALLIASVIYKADQYKRAKQQQKIEKRDTTKTSQMPAKTLILDNVLNSNQK